MTVFYRGPDVRITHEVIEVWRPAYRWYAIRDIAHVYVVEQTVAPQSPVGLIKTGSTSVGGATALLITLGWAMDWRPLESPVLVVASLTLLVASIVITGACWRVSGCDHELDAIYRGRLTCVYRTTDAQTFGQVRRALTRALEQLGDTR